MIVQHTIPLTQLRGIAYEIHIVSKNLITKFYIKIIQYIGYFTNKVQEIKMSTQLIKKQVLIEELVLQDTLVFLVEAHLKPVLGYSSEISHCEVDFYNVCIELYQISVEIQVTLKQESTKLIKLSTTKGVRDVGFSSP